MPPQMETVEKEMATHSRILAWRIPMDRGAWWAAVHGVAKSQTRLSDRVQSEIDEWCFWDSGGCEKNSCLLGLSMEKNLARGKVVRSDSLEQTSCEVYKSGGSLPGVDSR